eukprot:2663514-Rhodomonas_salina.7
MYTFEECYQGFCDLAVHLGAVPVKSSRLDRCLVDHPLVHSRDLRHVIFREREASSDAKRHVRRLAPLCEEEEQLTEGVVQSNCRDSQRLGWTPAGIGWDDARYPWGGGVGCLAPPCTRGQKFRQAVTVRRMKLAKASKGVPGQQQQPSCSRSNPRPRKSCCHTACGFRA